MSQSLQEICVKDERLCMYVKQRARRIQRFYKHTYDVDDIVNTLWIAVFTAIDKRYSPPRDVIDFARDVVFSTYGHLLPAQKKGRTQNNQLVSNERCERVSFDMVEDESSHLIYTVVDARLTLEAIEESLRSRWNLGRTYQLAYKQFKHLRKDGTQKQFVETEGISRSYASYLFENVTKKIAKKEYA